MSRISSLATQIRAVNPTDLEDYDDPSLGTSGSRKGSPFDIHGQFRNALAPRGGIAFDGTVNCRAVTTLNNQNIGTDDFSLSVMVLVPIAAVDSAYIAVGPATNDIARGAGGALMQTSGSGGFLQCGVQNSTDYKYARLANFFTAWGGKRVMVTMVRAGATMTVYVNGVAQVTTIGDNTGGVDYNASITSTYLALGFRGTNYSVGYVNTLYSAALYNYALSATDVLEIYELGGAVPERFKWGSQASLLADAASDGVFTNTTTHWSSWGIAPTVAVDTVNQWLTLTAPSAGVGGRLTGSSCYTPPFSRNGGRMRVRGTVGGLVGNQQVQFGFVNGGGLLAGVLASPQLGNGAFDVMVEIAPQFGWPGFQIAGSGSVSVWLDGFIVNQVGAVAHFTLDDGAGLQIRDASPNKLDAVITATGVNHITPRRRASIRATLVFGASGNLQIFGQAAIDTSRRWRIASVGGNSSAATARRQQLGGRQPLARERLRRRAVRFSPGRQR